MSHHSTKDIPENPRPAKPSDDAPSPIEDFVPGVSSAQQEDMEETIRKLREDKKHLAEDLLRKQAEFENFRKRKDREKEEFLQYSLFDAVKTLVPVLDGFELALGSQGQGEDYRKGVALIHQQLAATLQKLGLKAVETKGHEFDPRVHEALAAVETSDYPEHHIVDELQRGYFFKDRLLRPARVKVAQRPSTGKNS